MENVKGLLDRKSTKCKREHLLEVMAELILLNYQVRLCVCNASDYGDAQDRVRVILFGARKDYKLPDFPKATHGTMEDVRKGIVQQLRKTARDVLGDLEMIDPVGRGETVKQDAKRIRDHTTQGTDLGKHNTMQLLVAEEPVMTVCKKNPMKHYSKERKLTVREFARLQSFPDVFQFVGEHSDKRSQIGNAVPLNLGRAVARAVMDSHRHYRSRWDAQSNSERRTS
jgi:DNA (cytosine-5)-methyltransferase 1